LKGGIDVHAHLAALPEGDNGCYISPRMMKNPITRFLAWTQGLDLRRPVETNARYIERLLRELSRSEKIGQVVLLGLDGVGEFKSGGNRLSHLQPLCAPDSQALPGLFSPRGFY